MAIFPCVVQYVFFADLFYTEYFACVNPILLSCPSPPTLINTNLSSISVGLLFLLLLLHSHSSVFSSVAQSCLTFCHPMDCSTPGFHVHHQLPELIQTHIHWVGDAIQPSCLLLSPYPPAFNHYQHQGLFKWVSFSHQMTKVLEFQLQHQSFQWIFRTDFL